MKRLFVCASSCVKYYVQPFIWLLCDAGMFILCEFFYLIHIFNYKKVPEQERRTLKKEQKVGMLLQKITDTRGVGISNMRKAIIIPPYNHTH